MDPLTLLAVAFGLAMGAFSVSVASGTAVKNNSGNKAFKMAFSFGAFQAFMHLLGWLAGVKLLDFISGVDHWLAFGLMLFVGFKMIYESTKPETHVAKENLSLYTLLILSVATSIDALAKKSAGVQPFIGLAENLKGSVEEAGKYFDIPNKFDAVFSTLMLHYSIKPEKVFRSIVEVLSENRF